MNKIMRQGDILISRMEKLDNVELKEVNELVLALGEVTFHRHILVKENSQTKIEIANDGIGHYLKISNGNAVIKHEEHRQIILKPGIYHQIRQVEYDPIQFQRTVRD